MLCWASVERYAATRAASCSAAPGSALFSESPAHLNITLASRISQRELHPIEHLILFYRKAETTPHRQTFVSA